MALNFGGKDANLWLVAMKDEMLYWTKIRHGHQVINQKCKMLLTVNGIKK